MGSARTIALLQQKGGSGKTTTCVNIAGSLKEMGYKVAICDMDKDKPDAWSWAVKNDSMKNMVYQIDEKQARDQITKLKSHHDYIIIDTPSTTSATTYTIQGRAYGSAGGYLYINHGTVTTGQSSIILMEIAQ